MSMIYIPVPLVRS